MELDKVQMMIKRQGRVLRRFDSVKEQLLILAGELKETEPKTANFVKGIAEGSFNAAIQHFMLESRSNVNKASEGITIDDIIKSVDSGAVVNNAEIIPIKSEDA